jgi:hypothetical protein
MRVPPRFWLCLVALLELAAHETVHGQSHYKLVSELVVKAAALDENLRTLLVSRDGSMLASDDASRLLLFSPEGVLRRTLGGAGAGPGEFRSIQRFGLSGSDWWFFDASLARLTVFDRDGNRLLTESTEVTQDVSRKYFMMSPVALPTKTLRVVVGLDRPGGQHLALLEGGRPIQDVLTLPPPPKPISIQQGKWRSSVPIPFQHLPAWDVSTYGEHIAFVRDSILSGDSLSLAITVIDPKGRILVQATDRLKGITITKADVDSAIEVRLSMTSSLTKNAAASALKNLPMSKIPHLRPAFLEVVVGQDSSIWLRQSPLASGTPWRVYSFRGAFLGTVLLPPHFRLWEARRNRVWGLLTDSDGFRNVVRYRLVTTAPPSQ